MAVTLPSSAPLSVSDLLAFDPMHPRRTEGETRTCCPLCGSSRPVDASHRSLSYNVHTGLWHCHRCHEKGMLREYWPEHTPQEKQGKKRGIARRKVTLPALPAPEALEETPPVTLELKGMVSLLSRDGVCGANYLSGRGLPADFCDRQGVRFHPSWFKHPAVMFAVRDGRGRLVAAQGRFTDGHDTPKAITKGPRKQGVFASRGALTAEAVLVFAEAPIDALTLAYGGLPAVALCGSSGIPEWLVNRYAFRTVIAAFDADEAGDNAAVALSDAVSPVGGHVFRLRPDGAKDWNALLTHKGKDALTAVCNQARAEVEKTLPPSHTPETKELSAPLHNVLTYDEMLKAANRGILPLCYPARTLPSNRKVNDANNVVRGLLASWKHAQEKDPEEVAFIDAQTHTPITWGMIAQRDATDLDALTRWYGSALDCHGVSEETELSWGINLFRV